MFCLQNKSFFNTFWLTTFVLILTSIYPAQAANKAKQETVNIKAKYLLLDENKGISTYKGKVIFSKGTLTIKADTVTLYYHGENLTKALIIGSPADVRHEPDNEAKVHSQAKEMEFFVDKDKLTLKGQAFVDQGNSHFSGEYIEYDTRQRIFTAASNQDSVTNGETSDNNPANNRVHVIIGPTEDAIKVDNNDASTSNEELIENE